MCFFRDRDNFINYYAKLCKTCLHPKKAICYSKNISHIPKGQLISKCPSGVIVSTLLLLDLFLFVFWKKVKTPKRHLEIN